VAPERPLPDGLARDPLLALHGEGRCLPTTNSTPASKFHSRSYPERDSLSAETGSDVDDHASARTAFLNELVADERTGQLFDAWRTACGLNITALQERAAVDPDRAADEFADSFDANVDQLSRRALAFVRDDLRLPWAWVIFEVLEAYHDDIAALTPRSMQSASSHVLAGR
jgi:hypothetical protein